MKEYKQALFGNQKQSNEKNTVIAQFFADNLPPASSVQEAAQNLINFADAAAPSDPLFILLCGPQSAVAKEAGNYTKSVTQDENTGKVKIRFFSINKPNHHSEIKASEEREVKETYHVTTEEDLHKNNIPPHVARVNFVRDQILPHVPSEIKAKYPDNEYAQCLAYAKAFYNGKE